MSLCAIMKTNRKLSAPAGRILEFSILHFAISEMAVLETRHSIVINEVVDLGKRFCDSSGTNVLECYGDPKCKKTGVAEHAVEGALWYLKHVIGRLLKQQLTRKYGNVEMSRIFSLNELKKATDNFSVDRVLGQGGQGTVYKGVLEDGRIIAVKKSIVVDEDKLKEFMHIDIPSQP